ncbi:MAG: hypothetical protein EOQ42_27630 [Mesorhizobium sp.]|uniref:hypothetical protein n=1 Tax=Mesorhizobium sp. TaxID=1871066 RepID=UPI000FE4A64C|nr:hypothetical protein [Mesorhizobium sp.]RWB31643.1 MAG: hypothetical protein EOQ43_10770 [Mesorhizobium sp.]RWB50351.1 MAG: hypothetical protein EOQ42_27630 [Mesorhizobium sp.]RWD02296.1 MAG: hypothetical protein EOS57_26785 [Mesorhizobium sp.]
MNEMGRVGSLGARLARLRPVVHALRDPHFSVCLRPIDGRWAHAGLTAIMSGFNPVRHVHYGARESVFAGWIASPETFACPPDREQELAIDVLRFAHDYLHSWAYRLIGHLYPEFRVVTPQTEEQLNEQAFFLVLSESIAVVGSDYWYLSLGGLKKRCGTHFDLGPCTVHYREKNLPLYRRSNPELEVQTPSFFPRLAWLYSTGEIEGFSEQDLLENRPLADWLVRELLIAPRQRVVSRSWLGHLGGVTLDDAGLEAQFRELAERHAGLIQHIGEMLWKKTRLGQYLFLPVPEGQGQWHCRKEGPLDCRYTNLRHVGARRINWNGGGVDCWNAFVDQVMAARRWPGDEPVRAEIAGALMDIRAAVDPDALAKLACAIEPVPGSDPAPLELLMVN